MRRADVLLGAAETSVAQLQQPMSTSPATLHVCKQESGWSCGDCRANLLKHTITCPVAGMQVLHRLLAATLARSYCSCTRMPNICPLPYLVLVATVVLAAHSRLQKQVYTTAAAASKHAVSHIPQVTLQQQLLLVPEQNDNLKQLTGHVIHC